MQFLLAITKKERNKKDYHAQAEAKIKLHMGAHVRFVPSKNSSSWSLQHGIDALIVSFVVVI